MADNTWALAGLCPLSPSRSSLVLSCLLKCTPLHWKEKTLERLPARRSLGSPGGHPDATPVHYTDIGSGAARQLIAARQGSMCVQEAFMCKR